ncbi:MAG: hypothetical protein JWN44_3570 [Myxococcales bacterium]|nr:hypothetical protein [Myxococcales bacterium]
MTRRGSLVGLVALLALPASARAHVGSPDVYFEGAAGPYRVLVTVQPPTAVPGIAEVSARVTEPVTGMTMVPLPARGEGARLSPTPDVATRDRDDPQTFAGHLWLMHAGEWQIRLHVDGARGAGELAIPVPALPSRTKTMQTALGVGLLALLLLLAVGAVSIAGAGAREGQLEAGETPTARERTRGWRAMALTGAFVVMALVGGNAWWNAEAGDYARYVYKPLDLEAHTDGNLLTLQLADPGWLRSRHVDDLLPDHGHLMHLFVVTLPSLDHVWHLHPEANGPGAFRFALPSMPAGRYRLYADVVHATGLAETATAEVSLPAITGATLTGDDATGGGPAGFDSARSVAPLDGGARMVFLRDDVVPAARKAAWFRFRVEDAAGAPQPLEPYMGMLGHAAFVRSDGSTFAHVHPSGSVPMASLAALESATTDPHAGHAMPVAATEVAFPYGFPRAGDYRIFVQVKRAGRIETGVFDARVP